MKHLENRAIDLIKRIATSDFRHGMSSLVFKNKLDFGSKINMLKGLSFSIVNVEA